MPRATTGKGWSVFPTLTSYREGPHGETEAPRQRFALKSAATKSLQGDISP